jgi:hemerythrin-like domain-containing protein
MKDGVRMPIRIGAKPEHGFDQPLGLLSDCHRRIEHFLGMMINVLERSNGGQNSMTTSERDALEAALKYFEVAAPRHTQDEEHSLFPRLRASQQPEALAAMARIESLEQDHERADAMHAQVHRICRQWLDGFTPPDRQLHQLLHDLRELYAHHIQLEDSELFPLAARLLSGEQLTEIGQEMARRRGLSADKTI